MTVLKARVAGAWQTIGSGFGPAGGVAGDLLVKNSAADFDAVWGSTATKLKLTPGSTVALDQNNPALQVGEQTGQNLVAYWSGIMSRNNGAASTLRLNYYGGQVIIGGGQPDQYTNMLQIADTAHATSRRAALAMGTGWGIGQDINSNGTKDFYIYQNANSRIALGISADGLATTLVGSLRIGGGAGPIMSVTSEWQFAASVPFTITASRFNVLNAAGNTWFFNHDGTRLWTPNPFVGDSTITAGGDLIAGGQVYAGSGQYFRVQGNGGFYWNSWGCGFFCDNSSWIRTNDAHWLSLGGGIGFANGSNSTTELRLYSEADSSNALSYRNDAAANINPSSGVGSNGPRLQGYATVWLRTNVDNNSFLFTQASVFIPAAGNYNKFSSREIKEEIISLDPQDCLEEVIRWQPVSYLVKENQDKGRRDGFIAEDMYEVSPQLVGVTPPNAERPNWPNAIDYSGFSVRLTGAVQALLNRVEELERKVA